MSECLVHNHSNSEKGRQKPVQSNESLNIAILFLNQLVFIIVHITH